MNAELGSMCKKAVTASFLISPQYFLRGLSKTIKEVNQNSWHPAQKLNLRILKYGAAEVNHNIHTGVPRTKQNSHRHVTPLKPKPF